MNRESNPVRAVRQETHSTTWEIKVGFTKRTPFWNNEYNDDLPSFFSYDNSYNKFVSADAFKNLLLDYFPEFQNGITNNINDYIIDMDGQDFDDLILVNEKFITLSSLSTNIFTFIVKEEQILPNNDPLQANYCMLQLSRNYRGTYHKKWQMYGWVVGVELDNSGVRNYPQSGANGNYRVSIQIDYWMTYWCRFINYISPQNIPLGIERQHIERFRYTRVPNSPSKNKYILVVNSRRDDENRKRTGIICDDFCATELYNWYDYTVLRLFAPLNKITKTYLGFRGNRELSSVNKSYITRLGTPILLDDQWSDNLKFTNYYFNGSIRSYQDNSDSDEGAFRTLNFINQLVTAESQRLDLITYVPFPIEIITKKDPNDANKVLYTPYSINQGPDGDDWMRIITLSKLKWSFYQPFEAIADSNFTFYAGIRNINEIAPTNKIIDNKQYRCPFLEPHMLFHQEYQLIHQLNAPLKFDFNDWQNTPYLRTDLRFIMLNRLDVGRVVMTVYPTVNNIIDETYNIYKERFLQRKEYIQSQIAYPLDLADAQQSYVTEIRQRINAYNTASSQAIVNGVIAGVGTGVAASFAKSGLLATIAGGPMGLLTAAIGAFATTVSVSLISNSLSYKRSMNDLQQKPQNIRGIDNSVGQQLHYLNLGLVNQLFVYEHYQDIDHLRFATEAFYKFGNTVNTTINFTIDNLYTRYWFNYIKLMSTKTLFTSFDNFFTYDNCFNFKIVQDTFRQIFESGGRLWHAPPNPEPYQSTPQTTYGYENTEMSLIKDLNWKPKPDAKINSTKEIL